MSILQPARLSFLIALTTALASTRLLAQSSSPPPATPQTASQSPPSGERGPGVPEFWVRPGYKVTLAAEGFGETRFMAIDGQGTLYVSQPNTGALVALRDENADGVYESKTVLLTGRKTLHGLCFADDGYLYFTTSGAIYRFKPDAGKTPLTDAQIQTVIPEGELPKGGGHWWRSIVVKDGTLHTSIGDSGNLTDETATDRQKIWRYRIDPATGAASEKTLFATGLRNTEKLRFRPGTDALYGADHGSDNFGARYGERGGGPITDVNPPCEFNHYIQGFNYGHPFVTGAGLPRPEFAARPDILQLVDNNTAPEWMFGGHWAPNGWDFLATDTLGMKGDALVALHGSWNARQKAGYRIEWLRFDPATGKVYGGLPLVLTLTEPGRKVLARPVDVIEAPDGSALFSCDSTSRIYRITRIAK